jgi:hypothetical protein
MSTGYDWQRHYEAAILETDCSRLPELMQVAQIAINARRAELRFDHNDGTEEKHALADALAGLAILREERRVQDSPGALPQDRTDTFDKIR